MFDFVPIDSYTFYFHVLILCMVGMTFLMCMSENIFDDEVVSFNNIIGTIAFSFIILYMGMRPDSYVFGDSYNYVRGYNYLVRTGANFQWHTGGEWLFTNIEILFTKLSASFHPFFLFCSLVYTGSLWLAMRRIFGNYFFIPVLVILSMFTFWSYGVNGIRNGMGASLFILAMTYVENLPVAAILCLCAVGIHKSVYLMIAAAILAWFVKNSYYYLAAWILCVIVSFFFGSTIQSALGGLSLFSGDDRFSAYMTGSNMQGELVQVSMIFRWDYLIYSSMGVIVGYYFIFRKNFQDEYYHWIYNTFLVTNAFWVLIIRAAYSNRFAQISWFIMPVVLIYPFLRDRFWPDHERKMGWALLLFYAFSFYFNIIKG